MRSAATHLSRVRDPPPKLWPDGWTDSPRPSCCGLAIYKKLNFSGTWGFFGDRLRVRVELMTLQIAGRVSLTLEPPELRVSKCWQGVLGPAEEVQSAWQDLGRNRIQSSPCITG
ncbi:hypothetical protein PoB_005192900 [Plakobranchus ocellatus]|uniref:Uncharacterized protein n=1 Tax=Plakobranchus ocellatus TaxID=259542 RepID=A0AAV4C411_9GAST|nr:hypothetical protein PoB_005192900 [Plakobranchus ocellatus]